MPDLRSDVEKWIDTNVGLPLYYCAECRRPVRVEGDPPVIRRPCGPECEGATVLAPRRSILAGEGGLNFKDRVRVSWYQVMATITGRCV